MEYRLLGPDGDELWVLDRMRPERRAEDGSILVGGVVADISERKRVEAEAREKLTHAALHDSLTGLANRASFLDHLELGLKRATRTGTGVALLFIDLDNFKLVNDNFGHAAGDELLKAVGSRLQAAVRANDVVARQGGDEFLILLGEIANPASELVAGKVRTALSEPFVVDGIEIHVSASIGIGLFPIDGGRRRGSAQARRRSDVLGERERARRVRPIPRPRCRARTEVRPVPLLGIPFSIPFR